jgi:TDG/mug DNA glycosylase family protein
MRTLPDFLRRGMKLIIVGCNPGEQSVRVGHYYAGRDNQFWPLLYQSGVIPEPLEYRDDKRVIEFGIGLTDLVKRPTRTIEELERQEFAEGRILLSQKLEEFTPAIVAFHGRVVFEKFAQRACKLGLQKDSLYGARVFVLPAADGKGVKAEDPGGKTAGKSSKAGGTNLRYFRQLARLMKGAKP